MIQLIIGDLVLPQTDHDRYSAHPVTLSQSVDMISGRRVTELRGKVWRIEYSYDYMGNDMLRQLLAALRQETNIPVAFLPDDGDDVITSDFLLESMDQPTFAFSRYGVGLWHNVSFVLREVRPHD